MKAYTVRSTYTGAESAASRAADVVVTLFLCALAVFVLFYFLFVPVETVQPRIQGLEDGDLVLVDRLAKHFFGFAEGDIVRADLGSGFNVYRVIAKGGCEITVRGGNLYADGALLRESYASGLDPEAETVFSVPSGSLLLLPDDRTGLTAADIASGILTAGSVYGEVRLRVYPLNKLNFYR